MCPVSTVAGDYLAVDIACLSQGHIDDRAAAHCQHVKNAELVNRKETFHVDRHGGGPSLKGSIKQVGIRIRHVLRKQA